MARHGSDDVAFVLIDGYDVRGYLTTLDESRQAGTEDTTVLGDAWGQNAATGVNRYELSQEGFYDDAAGAVNAALVAGNGVARVVAFGFAGNAVGQPMTGVAGPLQAQYDRMVEVGALHKASAEYRASGAIEDGVIVHALGAETTATGDTTAGPVDGAASSADGAALYLAITALALDGGTNVTITVEHSADDVTYTTLGTFAAATATGAERLVVAGTVNRYLAVSWAFGGAAGAARSVTFMVGVCRQ